jgi:hypothetical protein
MTVEKARFEPNVHEDLNTQPPIIPKIDVTSDPELVGSDSEPAPPGLSNNNSLTTYALTMSPSAPTLSTIAAGGGPPPSATLSNDRKRLTLVKSEVFIIIA